MESFLKSAVSEAGFRMESPLKTAVSEAGSNLVLPHWRTTRSPPPRVSKGRAVFVDEQVLATRVGTRIRRDADSATTMGRIRRDAYTALG